MTALCSATALANASDTLRRVLELPAVQRLGWTLLHSLWEGAAVAAALAIVLAALRRGGPQARYVASCAALLSMAVLPLATFFRVEVQGPTDARQVPAAVTTALRPASADGAPIEVVPTGRDVAGS